MSKAEKKNVTKMVNIMYNIYGRIYGGTTHCF